jgi:hypothetical protein
MTINGLLSTNNNNIDIGTGTIKVNTITGNNSGTILTNNNNINAGIGIITSGIHNLSSNVNDILSLNNGSPFSNVNIKFTNSTNSNAFIGVGGSNSTIINSSYQNNFFIHANCNIVLNAGSNINPANPHLFILSNGNIGIGTSTNLTSTMTINGLLSTNNNNIDIGTGTIKVNTITGNNSGTILTNNNSINAGSGIITSGSNILSSNVNDILSLSNISHFSNVNIKFTNSTNSNAFIGVGGSNSSIINSSYQNNFFIHANSNIVLNAGSNINPTNPHLFILSNGNIGIGTSTNLTSKMTINASVSNSNNILFTINTSSLPITGNIPSDGDRIILYPGATNIYPYSIGINTSTGTNTGMWFISNGTNGFFWYNRNTTTTYSMNLDSTGTLNVFNDIVAFNSTASDRKLKENIETINFNCMNLINKFNPVKFNWKNIDLVPDEKKNTIDYGFIAQEIEELLPHLTKNGKFYKTIKYEKIVPFLVKAIQELNKKVIELEKKIII